MIIYSDEYDKILYDGQKHISHIVNRRHTRGYLDGLSKSHRIAGFRVGWMVPAAAGAWLRDIEGLQLLASMRLCSNVRFNTRFVRHWKDISASTIWQSQAEGFMNSGTLHIGCLMIYLAFPVQNQREPSICFRGFRRKSLASKMISSLRLICCWQNRY